MKDTHQGEYNVVINHKVVKPTVEKKVYDNQDGTSEAGFYSSADHAINEEFKFQLTATLPASKDNGLSLIHILFIKCPSDRVKNRGGKRFFRYFC